MDANPSTQTNVQSANRTQSQALAANMAYLIAGSLFGFIAIRSEIVSWYRIQEMFRFQSFHMYGIIGSAVLVAALSVWLIKRFEVKSLAGEPISLAPKAATYTRYIVGGTLFGLGWALTGACPGPIFALIGAGFPAFFLVLFGALIGTYVYGVNRSSLPH